MTFTPIVSNKVSVVNSTNINLTASSEFIGTSEDVSKFLNVTVSIKSDVDSASLGVQYEFSSDNVNWDIVNAFTYLSATPYVCRTVGICAKYFRIRYTNGGGSQSTFRLQTKFVLSQNESEEKKSQDNALVDGFSRLRISNPYTLLTNSHIKGKNLYTIYEEISGASTSTYLPDESSVLMVTTGSGSAQRRSRSRAIYQPGKSLLIYMTGVLNNGSNAATVTSKIGYYDNDSGYYFQFNNGIISIVERTSVSGSLVETVVNQGSWNKNNMDGTSNSNKIINPATTLIYWFNMEWLGVGIVDCGVIIDRELILCHRFRHSNILSSVYIRTASLPPTYEIISTGGSGSLKMICHTCISEGGYRPVGSAFSVNMGESTKNINGRSPLLALRLKTGRISNINLKNVSVMSTTGANFLVELWRFVDTTNSVVLNNTTFISANTESDVEYNTAATNIDVSGGLLMSSRYTSNNNDSLRFEKFSESSTVTINYNSIPDLFVVCVTSVGNNETYIGSVDWSETI